MAQSYKIVLVGDGGVGKSTFIKRHRTGEFEKKYIPTQGVDVTPLTFSTNYGTIIFKVWDCAGQEKFGGLRDGYYTGADAAICMFDVTSNLTFKNMQQWIRDIRRTNMAVPIVTCGNKCDLQDSRKVQSNIIRTDLVNNGFKYFDISARSNYNFDKPWVELAKQITGKADLVFVESSAINIPEITEPGINIKSLKIKS